jgi:hypothetical protein
VGRITEFPWRLGKLGGVFVVLIATGVIVYFVMTGNPQPDAQQSAIRKYYESALGGRVPRAAADSLRVDVCDVPTGDAEVSVVHCQVSVDGHQWQPCFGFDRSARIVSGPYQIRRQDCDRIVYGGRGTFVVAP